jgi:hypothetical protein
MEAPRIRSFLHAVWLSPRKRGEGCRATASRSEFVVIGSRLSTAVGNQMKRLHIVQGGLENGDKKWLERAARGKLDSKSWIAPRSAEVGDNIVIYVAGYGFFATAMVKSGSKRRTDWKNRYGAALTSIKLIKPPISLGIIRRRLPKLTWAKYPRSITTPTPELGIQIRGLIHERRNVGIIDLDDDALAEANIEELRAAAMLSALKSVTQRQREIIERVRSKAIHLYVLVRAHGECEGCEKPAPFLKADGSPYLGPHHTTRLADDGPDHPANVIALCPTCHRRAHYSQGAEGFNRSLKRKAARLARR